MASSEQKRVQTIMERHIVNSFRGKGGVTRFVKSIDAVRYGGVTKQDAIWEWVLTNPPLRSDDDIMMFLIDDVKITSRQYDNFISLMKKKKKKGNPWPLMYDNLLYQAAIKVYDEYKTKHRPAVKRR